MVRLFRGTCVAVGAMHNYRTTAGPSSSSTAPSRPSPRRQHDSDLHDDDHEQHGLLPSRSDDHDESDHPDADGEGEGEGFTYQGGSGLSVPLTTRKRVEQQGDVVYDGDEETARLEESTGAGELVPYAHRDLKPAYV